MVNLLSPQKSGVKLHHLIKAPENTSWAIEKKNAWDASKPATVYVTPELTKEVQQAVGGEYVTWEPTSYVSSYAFKYPPKKGSITQLFTDYIKQ